MKPNQLILAAVAGVLLFFRPWAADDAATNSTEAAEIEALKQQIQALDQKVQASGATARSRSQPAAANTNQEQIQELDQKVRILERQHELDKEDAAAAAKAQPRLKLDASGFTLSSADTNFAISLHGVLQLDSRTFFADHNIVNDSFLLRRARPIITGTVFHDFDFNFTPDFGGSTVQICRCILQLSLPSANCNWRPANSNRPSVWSIWQSDRDTLFNERSLVTDLVPNRDLGVELHGDLFGGAASYAAGIFNGAPDYNGTTVNSDSDNDKAFAGRLFFQPWKTTDVDWLRGLGFGVGGSYESDRNVRRRVDAGLHHGRPAEIFRLHERRGGQRPALAGFAAGLLLLRAAGDHGRVRGFRPGRQERRRPGGFAEHRLGGFRQLGVDGRRRFV